MSEGSNRGKRSTAFYQKFQKEYPDLFHLREDGKPVLHVHRLDLPKEADRVYNFHQRHWYHKHKDRIRRPISIKTLQFETLEKDPAKQTKLHQLGRHLHKDNKRPQYTIIAKHVRNLQNSTKKRGLRT